MTLLSPKLSAVPTAITPGATLAEGRCAPSSSSLLLSGPSQAAVGVSHAGLGLGSGALGPHARSTHVTHRISDPASSLGPGALMLYDAQGDRPTIS